MIEIPEIKTASQNGRVSQYTIPANSEKYYEIHKERGTIILSSTNCQLSFLGQQNYFTPPSKVISWKNYKVKRLWVKTNSEEITITIIPYINVTSSLTVPISIYIPYQMLNWSLQNWSGGATTIQDFELDFTPKFFACRLSASTATGKITLYARIDGISYKLIDKFKNTSGLTAFCKLPVTYKYFRLEFSGQGNKIYVRFWR